MSSLVALVVGLDSLIQLMSVGTLLAYTCLPLSVLVLRYKPGKVGLESGEYRKTLSRETTGLSGISRSSSTASRQTEREEDTEVGAATSTTKAVRKSKSLSSLIKSKSFSESSELLTLPSTGKSYILSKGQNNSKKTISVTRLSASCSSTTNYQDNSVRPSASDSSSYQQYESALAGACNSGSAQALNTTVKSGTRLEEPNEKTSKIVNISTAVVILLFLVMSIIIEIEMDRLPSDAWWAVVTLCILLSFVFFSVAYIVRQPQSKTNLTFRVPFVPFLPLLATAINVFLMVKLSAAALIRFAVWLALGTHVTNELKQNIN